MESVGRSWFARGRTSPGRDRAITRACEEGDCGPYDLVIGAMSMTLTQDRDTVSGRASVFESPEAPAADYPGPVSPEGTLTFKSTLTLPATQLNQLVNIEFANVRFELAQNGEMTDTFEMINTRADSNGMYRVYARLRDMHRSRSPWDY